MGVRRGILLAVAAIACGVAAPCSGASSTPRGPDPVVGKWPRWPYPTTCGALAFDPVQAFSGPTGVELGSQPAEIALGEFLGVSQSPWPNRHDWRLVAESDGIAEFAHGRLSDRVEWLRFEQVDGQWRQAGYSGHCLPNSIVGDGPTMSWTLAAEQPAPSSATKVVRVHLSGKGPCDGGRRYNAHAHPVFRRLGKRLLLTIWLDPLPPGNYTCQAPIEPPLTVKLPDRLGNSQLYDGKTYPPRPASRSARLRQ